MLDFMKNSSSADTLRNGGKITCGENEWHFFQAHPREAMAHAKYWALQVAGSGTLTCSTLVPTRILLDMVTP